MNSSEHKQQVELFRWARENENIYPLLRNLFAIPNGSTMPYTRDRKGKVFSPARLKMVKEGMRKGVPDIFLAVSNKDYFGLFIEMKYGKNKLSVEQKDWMARLKNSGYAVETCYSFEAAKLVILKYLDII